MKITVAQYCEHTGYSLQKVSHRVRRGLPLPGITSIEKFGQTYVMEAVENWKEIAQPLGRYEHIAKNISQVDDRNKGNDTSYFECEKF